MDIPLNRRVIAERMDAEKRLRSLNALPGSGLEPKDGVVQGTPMWQEMRGPSSCRLLVEGTFHSLFQNWVPSLQFRVRTHPKRFIIVYS